MRLMIFSVLISFLISILLGPILIPLLHKLKFGQNIRKEGLKAIRKKQELLLWADLFLLFQ